MATTTARTTTAQPTSAAKTTPAAASSSPRVSAPAARSPLVQSGHPAIRLSTGEPVAAPGNMAEMIGGGEPLSPAIQKSIERSLNVNLQAVRVHTDAQAQNAAKRFSARAFTYGNHIFLGAGEQATDLSLMAHEAAHVVQQQSAPAVQRSAPAQSDRYEHEAQQVSAAVVSNTAITVQERTSSPRVQRWGVSDILDGLAELAANVPGFTLLTLIIGRNPINMRVVERNVVNLLRAFMGLIPGGEILFQVLNRYGIVQQLGDWVNQQTAAMGLTFQSIRDAFTRFTGTLGVSDIFSPGDVWRRAENIFTPTVTRIRNFVGGLISQAITWLKETFMQPLSNFCREIPGYGLVTVLLGRDPFTNVAVPRTALNVVRAFAEFIPGGTEKVNQLVESRALERAYQWFTQETQARNLTWDRVTGTFAQAWNSLRLEDVLSPIETLRRMITLFRPLMSDLISFAGAALMKLLELIFEAVMGSGGARILAILKRARATFLTIIQNPVGFLRNLLGAVGQGVRQFSTNILRHLRDGVIAWLTGPVAAAGIQVPAQWDLRGIIGFVLQILGLTWDRVRGKLVRLMGAPAVAMLEAGFRLIQEIREKGLVQALRDRVTEFFGQLRESALGAIRSFIQQRLVQAGITQLLSLLSPVGAIIQAIMKTYTTIQFFIQKINQILDMVESIVNSIAAIASGAIGAAANLVERTMARTIPIILDFLARFIGLGDVGAHVQATIRGLQARVDAMLDRAVEWIRTQASRLGGLITGGGRSAVATTVPSTDESEMVPFVIGREQHSVRTVVVSGRLSLRMSSELVMEFSDRVQRIRAEWIPLRRGHPAGNLESELNTLARDGTNLIVAANARRTERSRSRAMNNAINQLAVRLRDICRRFDITRIEGITNYQVPPAHQPNYQSVDSYGRAQGMSVTLSFQSRPHMRNTNTTNVNIPGIAIAGYQKGHLLAASLGGSNSNLGNFAPMSRSTNITRGGIVLFEAALRTALRQDAYPPWIVVYTVRCVYNGSVPDLGNEVNRLVGSPSAPNPGAQLFALARSNAELSSMNLQAALPATAPAQVIANAASIRRLLLMHFTPRRFAVNVQIEQAPEGGTLPASSPFDNHM